MSSTARNYIFSIIMAKFERYSGELRVCLYSQIGKTGINYFDILFTKSYKKR